MKKKKENFELFFESIEKTNETKEQKKKLRRLSIILFHENCINAQGNKKFNHNVSKGC